MSYNQGCHLGGWISTSRTKRGLIYLDASGPDSSPIVGRRTVFVKRFFTSESPKKAPWWKLLDQACTELCRSASDAIRLRHYSLRTEESYANWIKRFIRTKQPASVNPVWKARRAESGYEAWLAPGNVTVNTLPCPSWLSTEIAPPCASISSLAIANPNPVLTPLRDTSPR